MDLPSIYEIIGKAIPLACMKYHFMQHALLGLLLLAPMVSTMGVQVVNARMAFFSDAIGHSAFAGVALGIMLSIDPLWSMPLLGVAAGLGIVAMQRRGNLSTDTAIGVSMSAIVAFGLAIVSRDRHLARNMNSFLFGDILSISDADILALAGLFALLMAFQLWSYNRIALMTVNQIMAKTHGVSVRFYCYAQAALLSALVIFSVRAVGVFLVTAMLVVPAATARNLANSAGEMFWWALAVGLSSSVAGLLISAQKWSQLATGATIILCACACFMVSLAMKKRIRRQA